MTNNKKKSLFRETKLFCPSRSSSLLASSTRSWRWMEEQGKGERGGFHQKNQEDQRSQNLERMLFEFHISLLTHYFTKRAPSSLSIFEGRLSHVERERKQSLMITISLLLLDCLPLLSWPFYSTSSLWGCSKAAASSSDSPTFCPSFRGEGREKRRDVVEREETAVSERRFACLSNTKAFDAVSTLCQPRARLGLKRNPAHIVKESRY